jgi:hypothetical protein
MVIRELTANLMVVSCPWGHGKGHLGLVQDPTIYAACNGAAFNIPTNKPPAYPVMLNGTTAPQREDLHTNSIDARKAWATYKLVLAITQNQFAAAIDNVYYAVLNNPTKGLNGVEICTLTQHIQQRYAQISQPDLDDNLAQFNTGISPGLPLAVYTRKQEKCQIFASDAGVPISDAMMVTTGCKHAIASGNMTLGWREWKRCPPNELTWIHWKIHWTAVFAEMRDLNQMTAVDSPFGANQAATEMKQAQQMATSLDNLANASIQKKTTIKSLIATNAALSNAVQDIQQTLARMTTAVPIATPVIRPIITPDSSCPCPSHWNDIKPA